METRDPLLALMFSFILPGLGQMFSGRFWRGLFFSVFYVVSITAALAFLRHPTLKTGPWVLIAISAFFIFLAFVHVDAYLFLRKKTPAPARSLFQKIVIFAGLVFSVFFFNTQGLLAPGLKNIFLVAPRVRSNSMSPAIQKGDWFLIKRFTSFPGRFERGELVVFHFFRDIHYRIVVKRLIAFGGEKVFIKDGRVYVNG